MFWQSKETRIHAIIYNMTLFNIRRLHTLLRLWINLIFSQRAKDLINQAAYSLSFAELKVWASKVP